MPRQCAVHFDSLVHLWRAGNSPNLRILVVHLELSLVRMGFRSVGQRGALTGVGANSKVCFELQLKESRHSAGLARKLNDKMA